MAKADTFTDTFDAQDFAKWWGYTAGKVVVSGGVLTLTPTSSYYPYLESATTWDLTESYFAFQLVQNANAGNGGITTEAAAVVDASNYASILISGGQEGYVTFRHRVGGVNSDTSVVFNPVRHKWFRIRHSVDTIYWETSADSATWVVRRSVVTSLTLTAVLFRFIPGFYGSEPSPGSAKIDNVNLIAGTAIGSDEVLPSSMLTDDFSATSALKWFYDGSTVSSGGLRIVPSTYYGYAQTPEPWNMTDNHFMVQLVQNGSGLTTTSELTAKIDNDNAIKIIIPGSGSTEPMILRERVAGVNSDVNVAFLPDRHKWFRIRHSSGSVYWEVSRDGATWSVLRSKAAGFSVSAVYCTLSSGFYGTEAAPGVTVFDNLNLPNLARLREIGWYTGTALPFGGLESGTVQQKVFFKDADWLWDEIPASPVLDPNSAAIVSSLAAGQHPANTWDYGVTIVKPSQINGATPRYQFVLDNYPAWGPDPLANYLIPIPDGTVIPPGSDGHLTVMDPDNGKVYSFWQAYKVGSVWHASWAGVSDFDGDGRDYEGNATATELSRLAGVVLLNEIEAGEIPHALFFASNMAGPEFRYPATKSDGYNLSGAPITIPEGARVQLDPSIDLTAIPGISFGELAVGRALQRYGAYCGDQGGSRMGFIFEFQPGGAAPGASYVAAGFGWDYFDMSNIPWSSLRVLKNWDGSA